MHKLKVDYFSDKLWSRISNWFINLAKTLSAPTTTSKREVIAWLKYIGREPRIIRITNNEKSNELNLKLSNIWFCDIVLIEFNIK